MIMTGFMSDTDVDIGGAGKGGHAPMIPRI
jgi:hypothetical protein